MAIPNARALARPAKDEWGVYDPQQAGLAALFARLDSKDQKDQKDQKVIAPVAAAPVIRKDVPEEKRLTIPGRPTLRDAK